MLDIVFRRRPTMGCGSQNLYRCKFSLREHEYDFSFKSFCIHGTTYAVIIFSTDFFVFVLTFDLQVYIILSLHRVSTLLECLSTGSRPARLERRGTSCSSSAQGCSMEFQLEGNCTLHLLVSLGHICQYRWPYCIVTYVYCMLNTSINT